MGKFPKIFMICLIVVLLFSIFLTVSYANSAEPPSILIIVPNGPEGLEIWIDSGDRESKANVKDKIIEKYYTFYSSQLKIDGDYTIKVKTGETSFEIPMEKPLKYYNNVFTLNVEKGTLTEGKLLSRSILLVGLRIAVTLIIEALIFYLFGYRQKKSWLAFLIINLLTQGALNIWLNMAPPMVSYIGITLIFGEFFVFLFEGIAFSIIVGEHKRRRTIAFVLLANFLSLVAGGYILTYLPL